MPDPYDYTSAFANLQSPQAAIMEGIKNGVALTDVQALRAQQHAALAQQQQMQSDLATLSKNPTPDAIAALMIKYPALSEQLKRSSDVIAPAQHQAQLDHGTQVYAAVLNNQPDIAQRLLTDRAAALRNSGNEREAAAAETFATMIKDHPEFAKQTIGMRLAAAMGPDKFAAAFKDIGSEQRAADEAPAELAKKTADAAIAGADSTIKNLGIVGQTLGSLQGKGAKPEQAKTAIGSLVARGVIKPEDKQAWIDQVPTDPAQLDTWLGQQRAAGMKPDDQQKYIEPDANTRANNSNRLAVEDRIDARAKADREAGDDVTNFTPEAVDNAAARYNLDGTLPPMGMGAAASAGRTKILNRAAELKAGVDPEQQRRDQLNNKNQIANQGKAVAAFNTGKQGNAVRSFNVLLSHLDTLDSLSDALDNGNIQIVNRLANAYAKQTGKPAPTNFDSVKHIVADEVVKAITGGAGALGDREESAKAINGASSPAQLKGVIQNIKQLSVGQLGGLEQQYSASTGLNDFEHYLSPAARLMRAQHAPAAPARAAAPALPAGWSVEVH